MPQIDLYETHIRHLSPPERLRLAQQILADLDGSDVELPAKHDLLELRGLGADIWASQDAQEYVTSLRDEWENRR